MTALELVLAELEKFNKMYDDLQKEDWSKENFQVLSDREDFISEITSSLVTIREQLREENAPDWSQEDEIRIWGR
jgi:parvulin-like peptidyl-prolyl isomerase